MSHQRPQPTPIVTFSARVLSRAWGIRREDFWLAAGYFAVFWILDAVQFGAGTDFDLPLLATNWPLFAALGCIGVLLRRIAMPVMAVLCGSAAVMLLLGNHPAALVLVFELFFSLVLFGSIRVSTVAASSAVGLSVLLTLVVLALTGRAEPTVVAAAMAALTLLMPVEWAGNLRKAQRLAESESARAEAVRQSAEHRRLADQSAHELALERERQHMARELHDVLSARLSAIALQSGAALHTPSPHSRVLAQIRTESVAGLEELNTMIRFLHAGALDEAAGNSADLPSLVEQYRLAGSVISLDNSLHDGGDLLPLQLQTTIYRVAAESLRNACRHSPGTPVTISLKQAREFGPSPEIVLVVSNPLSQRPPEAWPHASTEQASTEDEALAILPHPNEKIDGTGTGIPSMHFRAAHSSGTLTVGAHSGWWVVELRLPATAESRPSSAIYRKGATA